jgi:hypothetical protein
MYNVTSDEGHAHSRTARTQHGDVQARLPWRASAYDAARRLFEVSLVAARAVFVGTWLGLLDRHALHAADELYYRRVRMYHNDSYNLSGLSAWEADALDRYFQGCRSVLVTSAGGGREVVALERQGLEVFAFECHPELVDIANDLLSREGLKARVAPAPRDQCPTCMPLCDGIILGWGADMLMPERSLRIRFLQQLRAHIPAGGPLLLSFFARTQATRYMRLTATIANGLRMVRGRPRAEIGDDLAPNFVHHFSEDEIAAELRAGGFHVIEFSRAGYPHAVAQAVGTVDAQSVIQNH